APAQQLSTADAFGLHLFHGNLARIGFGDDADQMAQMARQGGSHRIAAPLHSSSLNHWRKYTREQAQSVYPAEINFGCLNSSFEIEKGYASRTALACKRH